MINTGETVRVTARPFDWDGVLDEGATVAFSVAYGAETLVPSTSMPFNDTTNNYEGSFIPTKEGYHVVRIVAVLTDGSTSVDVRKIEVRG